MQNVAILQEDRYVLDVSSSIKQSMANKQPFMLSYAFGIALQRSNNSCNPELMVSTPGHGAYYDSAFVCDMR